MPQYADAPTRTVLFQQLGYYALHYGRYSGARYPVLLALHGYMQSAEVFAGLFHATEFPYDVIIPQALNQVYVEEKNSAREVRFSWLTRYRRMDAVAGNIRFLETVLKKQLGAARRKIFLLGYSQSGSLAYSFMLRAKRKAAGLIQIGTGGFPDYNLPLLKQATRVPVLLLHGKHDSICPIKHAHSDRKLLQSARFQVTLKTTSGGHRISRQQLDFVSEWMARRCSITAPR